MAAAVSAHPVAQHRSAKKARAASHKAKVRAAVHHGATHAKASHPVTMRTPWINQILAILTAANVLNAKSAWIKMVNNAAAVKALTAHASAPHATTHAALPLKGNASMHHAKHVNLASSVNHANHVSLVNSVENLALNASHANHVSRATMVKTTTVLMISSPEPTHIWALN